jgi:hypothetical protein
MKAPTYTQKLERAIQQHEAVTKAEGKPGPRFNQYLKMRKQQVKQQQEGQTHASK